MKYLVRAVKYFFYLLLVLALIIFALVAFKVVDSDPSQIFVHGYDSYWQIAAIMAVLAALYPRMGYGTRSVILPGETSEILPLVRKVMGAKGYVQSSEQGEDMVWVKASPVLRALRLFEDCISFTRTATGYDIEGPVKDIVRIVSALESDN